MEATATVPVTKRIWDRIGYGGSLLIIAIAIILVFYFVDSLRTEAVLASAIRQSTPLILGALCGLLGERTGIINIGIEGQMLTGAFVAFLVNVYTSNLILAIFAGIFAGILMGSFLAFMSVTLKMDQIIGGTVINILAIGLTGFFYVGGLSTEGKLRPILIPFLSDLPLVGKVFFSWPPITYIAIILVFVLQYVIFHTRWGLRSRSVGEHPRAADTVGINVFRMRYINVSLAGGLAGLAGAQWPRICGLGCYDLRPLDPVGLLGRSSTFWPGFGPDDPIPIYGYKYSAPVYWNVSLSADNNSSGANRSLWSLPSASSHWPAL
jgi:simple sugar transport system permease protein